MLAGIGEIFSGVDAVILLGLHHGRPSLASIYKIEVGKLTLLVYSQWTVLARAIRDRLGGLRVGCVERECG